MARFQDFRAKKLRNIYNKYPAIYGNFCKYTEKISKRNRNRLKSYESFWCSIRDAEHREVYYYYYYYLSDLSKNDRVAPKGIACTKGASLNIHT